MAEREPKWPFGATDGGPGSRPLLVDLENVLIAMVASDGAAERAVQALEAAGFSDADLRRYTSAQILAYDQEFRDGRGLKERIVGAVVDDADSMESYVEYARQGCAALWILVDDRSAANRLIRQLADFEIVYLWFHGTGGLETIQVR